MKNYGIGTCFVYYKYMEKTDAKEGYILETKIY